MIKLLQKQTWNKVLRPNYDDQLIMVLLESVFVSILVSNLIAPILFIVLVNTYISFDVMAIWLVANLFVFLARYFLSIRLKTSIQQRDKRKAIYLKQYILLMGLNGLIWGLFSYYLISFVPDKIVSVTILVLVGLTSGAISTLGSVFHAFVLYSVTITFFLFLALIRLDDVIYNIVAILFIFYLYVITSGCHRQYRLIKKNIRINKELVLAKQGADEANHAKIKFLAKMSHEIRTPMNTIMGFTELCKQTPEKKHEYLAKIQGSSEELMELLDKILDLTHIESGDLKLASQVFDLNLVLKEVKTTAIISIAEKPIRFSIENPLDDSELLLKGDSIRLNQILANLISNAIKFTEQGEIKLIIKNHETNIAFFRIEFIVQDTGIGISNEQQQQLFQNFVHTDNTISRRYGGSGLGLAICKHLIEKMGGTINLQSEMNKGTTISFCLNLMRANEIEQQKYLQLNKHNKSSTAVAIESGDSALAESENKADLDLQQIDLSLELSLLHKSISDFDTNAINLIENLSAKTADSDVTKELRKITGLLNQFDYEEAIVLVENIQKEKGFLS